MSDSQSVDPSDNALEVNIETLDQWEAELDQFTADIKRRLSLLSLVADVTEPMGHKVPEVSEADQVLDLLKSLSEQTQQ
ncbi:MAG: hypothetical protein AAFU85_11355 [Planctomycetota bacterium]